MSSNLFDLLGDPHAPLCGQMVYLGYLGISCVDWLSTSESGTSHSVGDEVVDVGRARTAG